MQMTMHARCLAPDFRQHLQAHSKPELQLSVAAALKMLLLEESMRCFRMRTECFFRNPGNRANDILPSVDCGECHLLVGAFVFV